MTRGDSKTPQAIGFLTVIDHAQLGLMGGYLVLNLLGRPLEFHCTTPLKPNRAQQILYGATLEPYLYGEQIGQTLVSKASIEPLAVCTDAPAALALREHVAMPVVLVCGQSAASTATVRLDPPHSGSGRALNRFRLGVNEVAVEARRREDQSRVTAVLSSAIETFDLSEPFGRIRDAIEEAQRGGR
jgi:hypothetical protein